MADFVNQLAYGFLPILPIAAEYDPIFAADDDVRRTFDTVSLGQALHFFSGCEASRVRRMRQSVFAVKAFLCRAQLLKVAVSAKLIFCSCTALKIAGLPDTSNPKR